MFTSLSDTVLSGLRWWVGWFAALGSFIGVVCAVITIFATREATRRSNVKLAAAEKNALDARALADKLEHAAKPRAITDAQSKGMIESLIGMQRGTIEISYSNAANDGYEFAKQIFDVLSAAGGYVMDSSIRSITSFSSGKPLEGIVLRSNSRENRVAAGIQKAMEAAGIESVGRIQDDQKIDLIIVVYPKPRH